MSRFRFLGHRILELVPVALGITIITFFLLRLIPGDPATLMLGSHYTPEAALALQKQLGLDLPAWRQYLVFMQRLVHGNLGTSIYFRMPVNELVLDRAGPTLFLVAYAAVLALVISLPTAIIAALRKGGVFDQVTRVSFLITFAMPSFWTGIILILIFSLRLGMFPVSGYGDGLVDHLWHLLLPAFTIGLAFSVIIIRTLRASILTVMRTPYVDTARIKGISRAGVLRRHVLRNAMLSIIVVFGINLAYLISSTVIMENLFAIPGLGQLLVTSVFARDYPAVQGVTLVFAFLVITINLLTDVVYALFDPRVTYD